MFDDDYLPKPFSTRDGQAIGGAAERQMLSQVGPLSIRTVVRNNPDGSQTVLRTRAGHPEFATTAPAVSQAMDYVEPNYAARTYWDVPMSMWESTITFRYVKSITLKKPDNTTGLLAFPMPPEIGGNPADFYAQLTITAPNRIFGIKVYPAKKATLFGAAITLPDPAATSLTDPPGAYTGITLFGPHLPGITGSLPRLLDYGVNTLKFAAKNFRFAVPSDG